jgi:predicted phage tail protein
MTLINLHGILGHEFQSSMFFKIKKPKEVIEAISSKFSLFRKRMNELIEQGIHYSILVNGEKIENINQLDISNSPEQIDLVPVICGSGAVALAVVGAGLMYAGATGAIFGFSLGAAATLVGSIGSMMVSMALQMMLAPKPDMQKTEATVSGAKQSFLISSKANLAEQGNPVPVGYGRLRVGSSVIQTTIKSYPQNYNTTDSLVGTKNTKGAVVTNSR